MQNNIINPINSSIILGLMLVGQSLSLNQLTWANNDNQPKYDYPDEVKKTYLRGCTYTNSLAFCQCTMNKFQSKYNFQAFRQLENQYIETKKIPPEVLEIFWACRKAEKS